MANGSAPISVPASTNWDGNDGPWSTFYIHIGNPQQVARVLVSTTVGETWVISANTTQGGCLKTDPSSCHLDRGVPYNMNKSSTWQDQGIFELGDEINLPDYNGPYDVGDYGFDSLGLGLPNTGLTLSNMTVAALATKDFFLGNLGINPAPTNLSESFNDPRPSFLDSLKKQGHIPSLSFGYTAGNPYRLKKSYGSLTLGGYDASLFTPNNVSFEFAPDNSRDLVVGLQAIEYNDAKSTNKPLLSEGILTFVDSTVPQIWLPKDSCTLFEDAFGITYNSSIDRYTVNDTLHQQLLNSGASVSFILGNQLSGGQTVNITLPYQAFDLELKYPIADVPTKYFPLRQAANDSQYTLGRTFLQESYLTVNYEHTNFSISQTKFLDNNPSQLVAITNVNSTTKPLTKTHQSTFPTGAIVGVVVAIVLLAIISVVAFFLIRRRRRRRRLEEYEAKKKQQEGEGYDPMGKVEMDGSGKPFLGEMYGSEAKFNEMESKDRLEMEGSKGADNKLRAEMEGSKGGAEMDGSLGGSKLRAEMEGSGAHAEMEGNNAGPIEMWAGEFGLSAHELPTPDGEESKHPSPGSRIASTTDGQPSPVSVTWDRRSRMASWGRRHKHNKSRKDSDTSGISSQDEISSARDSESGAEWNDRRQRPRIPGLKSPPQAASAPINSATSRERRHRGGDALTQRLQGSSRHPPSQDVSLPSDGLTSGDESGPERRNRHFGSTARSSPPDVSSPSSSTGARRDKDSWPIRTDRNLPPPPPPPPPIDSSQDEMSFPGNKRRKDSWGSRPGTGSSTMGGLMREEVSSPSASEASGRRQQYDSWASRADSWATRPEHRALRDGSPGKRNVGGAERAPFDFF